MPWTIEHTLTTINIDMNKKCVECRKGGAAGNGLCMKCALRTLGDKPMKSDAGRAMQKHFRSIIPKKA